MSEKIGIVTGNALIQRERHSHSLDWRIWAGPRSELETLFGIGERKRVGAVA